VAAGPSGPASQPRLRAGGAQHGALGLGAQAPLLPARLGEVEAELDSLRGQANELDNRRGLLNAVGRVSTAIALLESFDELWDALAPEKRVTLVRLLVERIDVDVDVDVGKLELHLHDLAASFPPAPSPPQGKADEADGAEATSEAAS